MTDGRRRTDGERLEELAERKRAIRARTEQRRRKEDTRRKILLGAWILHEMERSGTGGRLRKWAARRLPGFVRERDRHLFDGIGLDIDWGTTAETTASAHLHSPPPTLTHEW